VTLVLALAAATLITWAARATFIALVPVDLLPQWLPAALATATPAVLAALTTASLLSLRASHPGSLTVLLPLLTAAALARLGGNVAVVVLGALVAGTGLRLLGW
jgi:branched-subunit amino acid transport protein